MRVALSARRAALQALSAPQHRRLVQLLGHQGLQHGLAGQRRWFARRKPGDRSALPGEESARGQESAEPRADAARAQEPPNSGSDSDLRKPEVPAAILDAWMLDEMVQEAFDQFASDELQGKKMMSYRDVAQMLELMGCDRETFLNMFTEDSDGEEEALSKGGGKGGGPRQADEMDEFFASGGKNGPLGKGGQKGKDDFGKGSGKHGKGMPMRGGGGYDDFDDRRGGGKGGNNFRDFDDFDDRGGGKGGKKGFGGGGFGGFDDEFDDDFGRPKGKSKGKGKKGGGGKGKGYDRY